MFSLVRYVKYKRPGCAISGWDGEQGKELGQYISTFSQGYSVYTMFVFERVRLSVARESC